VAPQFIDRAQIAKNQQRIAYAQTPEGKAELAATKKRVEAALLKKEQARIQKEKEAKQRKLAEMQARIDDSKKVQDLPIAEQFTPDNLVRGTQAIGDKLRLFGPESPLVTSGLVEADPDSIFDEYINPAKMVGDMASDLASGTSEAIKSGSVKPLIAPVP
jgi:DNA-binding protein H-NS